MSLFYHTKQIRKQIRNAGRGINTLNRRIFVSDFLFLIVLVVFDVFAERQLEHS